MAKLNTPSTSLHLRYKTRWERNFGTVARFSISTKRQSCGEGLNSMSTSLTLMLLRTYQASKHRLSNTVWLVVNYCTKYGKVPWRGKVLDQYYAECHINSYGDLGRAYSNSFYYTWCFTVCALLDILGEILRF